eukprot:scaffold10496_cov32-Cyclotella_meneghiniana.AAC.3
MVRVKRPMMGNVNTDGELAMRWMNTLPLLRLNNELGNNNNNNNTTSSVAAANSRKDDMFDD